VTLVLKPCVRMVPVASLSANSENRQDFVHVLVKLAADKKIQYLYFIIQNDLPSAGLIRMKSLDRHQRSWVTLNASVSPIYKNLAACPYNIFPRIRKIKIDTSTNEKILYRDPSLAFQTSRGNSHQEIQLVSCQLNNSMTKSTRMSPYWGFNQN
jgi:hypothetical protein